jgi:FKBP-type peptidyl-prolyl cis-trans isomerase
MVPAQPIRRSLLGSGILAIACLCFFLFYWQKGASAQPINARLALVIGNSQYKDNPLRTPVNDALDMETTLRSIGFKVLRLENADRRIMKKAITEFTDNLATEKMIGMFYFAGHGLQVMGKNFIIPVDANIHREEDVDSEAVDVDWISKRMSSEVGRVNIIVLDACRNNQILPASRGGSRGFAPTTAAGGTFIAYATSPGATASDGEFTSRNGLFTGHLLKKIAEPGLNIDQVFTEVRRAVVKDSQARQLPWTSSSLLSEVVLVPSQPAPPARVRDVDPGAEPPTWRPDRLSSSSWKSTPTGVRYRDIAYGEGNMPRWGKSLAVHYKGFYYKGDKLELFASSARSGFPLQFVLGSPGVISGFQSGVSTMRVHGKRILVIPAHLGYGYLGDPRYGVPRNADLVYEVELVAVD